MRSDQWLMHNSGQVTQNRISRHDRPVVVIDPEDAEQVARLDALLSRFVEGDEVPNYEGTEGCTRAALREFAAPTPPKPAEPQGLGAVVEDAKGERWVRLAPRESGHPWVHMTLSAFPLRWSSIDAPRVVSEGAE